MNKTFFKLLMLLVIAMLITTLAGGQASAAKSNAVSQNNSASLTKVTQTYGADLATVFPNPERGYHNRYEIINDPTVNPYVGNNIPGFSPDQIDRTFIRAKNDGDTIIHSYIHLDNYQETDTLPQALLDNLTSGLAAIRAAGLKIILRPAYQWAGSPSVPEARILGHIAQLNAVISANADVVMHLEAGYLGPWGEWHTSLYTDPFNQDYASPRYHIIKKILDTTPDNIPVVVRYPIFIKEFLFPPSCVVSGGCTMTQAQKDRIGFHNDCFLSDAADMGTYDNNSWMGWFYIEDKRQWMYDLATSFGTNKMMGGETCDSAGDDDAAGVKVQNYMSLLNATEINEDYAAVNTNIWKAANLAASGNDPAETAFVRLKRKMGYRLRLVDATFPTSATAGNSFTFSAHLSNDGYSGIIKPRPIYLVFKSGTNRFNVQLSSVDVRTWLAGPVNLAQQSVTLPSNMPTGTYTLALWLPDYYASLQSRPEYSVRLANTGTWDATNGYNILSTTVSITNCPSCPTPTITNTPVGPTNTPTPTITNTPSISPLLIDSFSDSTKWATNHLNDLNKAVSWAIDSAYYNNANPGDIVLNSGGTGQYYQETITQSLGGVNLVLRLRDWSDTDTESHWNIVLNDGTDHAVALSTYANVNGTYTNFNIPLSAFGANLANTQYIRVVHKDSTYAVLMIDNISIDGGVGGPTATATPTNTPLPPTNTPTRTPTPTNTLPGPTNTPTRTPTPTNTLPGPTNTPTRTPTPTNTPVVPTNTPTPTATTGGSPLVIDAFPDSNKWSVQHLNDLNKSVSWAMDSIYYGDVNPGNIVMNSSPSGQYYQETVTQSLVGKTSLVLRLRDWSDTDTENHWNVVLNDGTDHTVPLNTYGNVTGSYTNISIPLSAFGANLANTQYVRIVHKDSTYAVLLIDTISAVP